VRGGFGLFQPPVCAEGSDGATGTPVLVESTCNQVNQFGGYTGMTPADFATYVVTLASQIGLAPEKVLLGGDHLGPRSGRMRRRKAPCKNPGQGSSGQVHQIIEIFWVAAFSSDGVTKAKAGRMLIPNHPITYAPSLLASTGPLHRLPISKEQV